MVVEAEARNLLLVREVTDQEDEAVEPKWLLVLQLQIKVLVAVKAVLL